MICVWFVLSSVYALQSPREISVRGRIVCVDENRARTECTNESTSFALEAVEGGRFYFSSQDSKTGMFKDPRVRARDLEVKAWVVSENELEIIKVYSVKDGQLHDLFYYCSVCSIRAFTGGPCWCCQQEFEFREVPF
jgi:hypothetical protein